MITNTERQHHESLIAGLKMRSRIKLGIEKLSSRHLLVSNWFILWIVCWEMSPSNYREFQYCCTNVHIGFRHVVACCWRLWTGKNNSSVKTVNERNDIQMYLTHTISSYRTPHTKLQKMQYLQYTSQLFFYNCNNFLTVFYMSKSFLTDLFRRLLAASCVVCKGLYLHPF